MPRDSVAGDDDEAPDYEAARLDRWLRTRSPSSVRSTLLREPTRWENEKAALLASARRAPTRDTFDPDAIRVPPIHEWAEDDSPPEYQGLAIETRFPWRPGYNGMS